MITINIWQLLMAVFMIISAVLLFFYKKILSDTELLKKSHEESLKRYQASFDKEYKDAVEKIMKEHNDKIAAIQKEHDEDIDTFKIELEELEKLATSKIDSTEEAYKEVIKDAEKSLTLYEKYIVNINTAIKLSDDKLKELDISGAFKSDDEIGWFFETVKNIQKILNEFKVEVSKEENK